MKNYNQKRYKNNTKIFKIKSQKLFSKYLYK